MSERSLMKSIDNFLFDQVSSIKAFSPYGLFQEFLAGLSDDVRDLVKYAISTLLVILPIFITLIFWSTNIGLKDDLEINKMIYKQANQIIQEDKIFGQAGKDLIGSRAPNNESDLSTQIGLLISRARIDASKVKVQNFQTESFSVTLSQNSADIIFNDLTTAQLSKMVSELIFRQKAKVNNVEIVRNDNKKLLEGKVSIVYLSQGSE